MLLIVLAVFGCNLFEPSEPVGADASTWDVGEVPDSTADLRSGASDVRGNDLDSAGPRPDASNDAGDAGDGTDVAVCVPESSEEFCQRYASQCGATSGVDNCSMTRTQDCGVCTAPATCGGGGTANVCGCPAQSDIDFCAAQMSTCGSTTGVDACMQMRTTNCGDCNLPETCGGGGITNQCGCTPESDVAFCAAAQIECGQHVGNDSCGSARTADCGTCPTGQLCNTGVCVSDGTCGNGFCDPGEEVSCPEDCDIVVELSGGDGHTCARRSDDTLWCWGSNSKGQFGTGDEQDSLVPRMSFTAGLIRDVSAGSKFTCIAVNSGAARCAGENKDGRLGAGLAINTDSSVFVDAIGLVDTRSVHVGSSHACAISNSGAASCWGSNKSGELGDGTTVEANTPASVSGGLTFASISAGEEFTCGTTPTLQLYCWGANGSGQLGDGTSSDRTSPVPVTLNNAVQVAAGGAHACAVDDLGILQCWGDNAFGALGNGSTTSSDVPVATSLTNVTAVDCGTGHCCAISNGDVYCWGANDFGQTGQPASPTLTPAVVGVSSAVLIATGAEHSCAATSNAEVYCWGSNLAGQLGNNSMVDSSTPVGVVFP